MSFVLDDGHCDSPALSTTFSPPCSVLAVPLSHARPLVLLVSFTSPHSNRRSSFRTLFHIPRLPIFYKRAIHLFSTTIESTDAQPPTPSRNSSPSPLRVACGGKVIKVKGSKE